VAYLRFARVYRGFESADDFDEIAMLRAERGSGSEDGIVRLGQTAEKWFWNVEQMQQEGRPCHMLCQFYVSPRA
jgi:hypothetical protein